MDIVIYALLSIASGASDDGRIIVKFSAVGRNHHDLLCLHVHGDEKHVIIALQRSPSPLPVANRARSDLRNNNNNACQWRGRSQYSEQQRHDETRRKEEL